MFAVLLMNAAVPLINRWTIPRAAGRTGAGEELSQPASHERDPS